MSHALLEEPASRTIAERAQTPREPADGLGPRWMSPLVLLAACAAALGVYAYFWQHSLELWWGMGHDRHTHYMYGLNLALDLRTGDFVRLFHDFDRMRVWGPVHPVLVALVEMAAGPDHRLAVAPSLAGWVLTIWCAFLIPRRLLYNGGNAAGVLAAFFVAVAPAHRAFATDTMYESLGAGLSLACIAAYLALLQDQTRRAAILLGVALSVLFLHKYNYWLLVVFGLTLGEFARQPRAWLQFALSLGRPDRLSGWLRAELKQPLDFLALALAAAALWVGVSGGGTIAIGRWSMSVQEPHNLVHLAYIAFFARLAWWWRQTGRVCSLQWPATLRTVLCLHGSVITLWFLLPKRLSYFLWFLSPNNDDQKREAVHFMHGLPYYLQGLQDDYLAIPGGIYLLGAMVALGLLAFCLGKLKPGAAALVFFLLVATYLTCQHPMLKYRFVHSWIAAAWVLGAVGLVFAVQQAADWVSQPLRAWTVGVACAAVIALHGFAILEPGRAQEGGLKANEPSPMRITETYLPALADAKSPTIVSNISARFLWTWTFIEHHHHQNMAAEIKNFKAFDGNPEPARRWLETTRSDALVLIDIHPGSIYDWKTDEYVDLAAFQQALREQSVWRLTERWELPEGVTITLWRN